MKWTYYVWHAFMLVRLVVLLALEYVWIVAVYRLKGERIPRAKLSKAHSRNAVRMRETAVKLKGALIKVGQILSTRYDIMPIEYIVELKKLQDMVEPYPYEYIASQVKTQLGAPPEETFAPFD